MARKRGKIGAIAYPELLQLQSVKKKIEKLNINMMGIRPKDAQGLVNGMNKPK